MAGGVGWAQGQDPFPLEWMADQVVAQGVEWKPVAGKKWRSYVGVAQHVP